jgi:hypothetical protein
MPWRRLVLLLVAAVTSLSVEWSKAHGQSEQGASNWKRGVVSSKGNEIAHVVFVSGASRNSQLTANLGVACSTIDNVLTVRLTAGKNTSIEFGTTDDASWPLPTLTRGYYSIDGGPHKEFYWHLSQNPKRVRIKPPESHELIRAIISARDFLRVSAENSDLLPVDYSFLTKGARAALAPILSECHESLDGIK